MNPSDNPEGEGEEPVFKKIRCLGQGGFASTWQARVVDEDSIAHYGSEMVAIKIPSSAKSQIIMQREVENNILLYSRLQKIDSIHLCRYLGFTSYQNHVVLVMEYVPDGNLRKVIRGFTSGTRIRLDWSKATDLIDGVLDGLVTFHRDIKPENILLDGQVPKIADLGISKFLATHQHACSNSCTYFYAAPEQLDKGGASFPADVWATAVMFYEMVTGRMPFGAEDSHSLAVINAICRDQHIPAHKVCPEVPVWMSDLIDQALEKKADARITAQQMRDALRQRGRSSSQLAARIASAEAAVQQEKDPVKAEALIRQLVEEFPGEASVFQLQGELFRQWQLHADAIDAFQKGLTLDARNAMLHWDLAMEYQYLHRDDEAICHLEQAQSIGLDAAKRGAAERLLKVLRARSDPVATVPAKPDPAPDPALVAFRHELARVQEQIQHETREELAEKALKELIEKFPRQAAAYQCLGEYYGRCGLDHEAYEAFLQGLAMDDTNPLLHWDIALICQRAGKKEEAIRQLNRALELDMDPGLRRHVKTLLKVLEAQKA
jgi:tetratricopeptide (TPR) repeat protein